MLYSSRYVLRFRKRRLRVRHVVEYILEVE